MSEQERTSQKADNSKIVIGLLILFILGMVLFPAVIIACFLAFLPTFAAFLTDSSKNYSLTFCVGICNLAAFIPCFNDLYVNKFSLVATSQLLHDPVSLLFILIGAAIGWLIHLSVPIITINIYQANDKSSLEKLVAKYQALKESWGDVIPESDAINSLKPDKEEEEEEYV